jgi:predicted transcriptional regulator
MDLTEERESPPLYEVKELTRDWGLVGEESTVLTVFLSFFGGGFVLMSGLSSGGKNAVVDAAAFCTPGVQSLDNPTDESQMIAKVPTSLSKTALYQRNEHYNSSPVHVHMDISSISDKQFIEDIWKAHGEGRSITHSWTQVMGQEREERSQTLHPPNCMILFLAEDNEQVDINDYPEVRNRALVTPVDDSADLTERVNERQAEMRADLIDLNVDQERANEIRSYVENIPMHTYSEGSGGFVNPVAPAIDAQNPLPQHFTEARRDFPRLLDFMESITLFHHEERMELPVSQIDTPNTDGTVKLITTPADGWLAMRIFGEKMVLSALNLREKDFELLATLRNNMGTSYTADELMQMMRSRGYNITDADIRSSMDNMQYKGYVRKHQDGARVEYSASEFAQEAKRKVQMDWSEVVDQTRKTVEEVLPEQHATDYIDTFLEGDGTFVTHPFTGETINLLEQTANELENEVDEREEIEEQVFDGEDPTDDDDDEPDGGQQSLTAMEGSV